MRTLDTLYKIVLNISCKPGWQFFLSEADETDGSKVLRFIISVTGKDSRATDSTITVHHYFPVPEATYNYKSWRRWAFECCLKVEIHEMSEWFLDQNERPFAPLHGPGEDPYAFHEFREPIAAYTQQNGKIDRPQPMEVPLPVGPEKK